MVVRKTDSAYRTLHVENHMCNSCTSYLKGISLLMVLPLLNFVTVTEKVGLEIPLMLCEISSYYYIFNPSEK